jgi:ankyrin repeat protein
MYDIYEVSSLLDKFNYNGPPTVVGLRELFFRDPAAARHEGLRGKTLLHLCLEFYASRIDILECFLDSHPASITTVDDEGHCPLHVAISKNDHNNYNAVKLLVLRGPEVLYHEDSEGKLPLHYACKSNFSRKLQILDLLIRPFPEALRHPDNFGKFPLNYALEQESKGISYPDAIAFLVDQCPSVLHEAIPDINGCLPLHSTVASISASPMTVQILADRCPRAVRIQDSSGRTPLFLACTGNCSLSVIYSLVRQWPEQVTTQCDLIFMDSFNGEMLPVGAASESITLERIQIWTKLHPEELTDAGASSRYPLHYAVVSTSKDAFEIVQHLIDCSSEGLSKKDDYGRLPLHYAAVSRSENAVHMISLLVDRYPQGLGVPDNDGRLPWHYAELAGSEQGELLYERSIEAAPDLDFYLVPEEVRWDIAQIIPVD